MSEKDDYSLIVLFFVQKEEGKIMRKISPRLLALMMAGAVTVTSITPVTGYQAVINAATDSRRKRQRKDIKRI